MGKLVEQKTYQMKVGCPRKYKSRRPTMCKFYQKGFRCGCEVRRAPKGGAPGDVLVRCHVVKSDRAPIDDEIYSTADEVLADLTIDSLLLSRWFERTGLHVTVRDKKRYEKLNRIGRGG